MDTDDREMGSESVEQDEEGELGENNSHQPWTHILPSQSFGGPASNNAILNSLPQPSNSNYPQEYSHITLPSLPFPSQITNDHGKSDDHRTQIVSELYPKLNALINSDDWFRTVSSTNDMNNDAQMNGSETSSHSVSESGSGLSVESFLIDGDSQSHPLYPRKGILPYPKSTAHSLPQSPVPRQMPHLERLALSVPGSPKASLPSFGEFASFGRFPVSSLSNASENNSRPGLPRRDADNLDGGQFMSDDMGGRWDDPTRSKHPVFGSGGWDTISIATSNNGWNEMGQYRSMTDGSEDRNVLPSRNVMHRNGGLQDSMGEMGSTGSVASGGYDDVVDLTDADDFDEPSNNMSLLDSPRTAGLKRKLPPASKPRSDPKRQNSTPTPSDTRSIGNPYSPVSLPSHNSSSRPLSLPSPFRNNPYPFNSSHPFQPHHPFQPNHPFHTNHHAPPFNPYFAPQPQHQCLDDVVYVGSGSNTPTQSPFSSPGYMPSNIPSPPQKPLRPPYNTAFAVHASSIARKNPIVTDEVVYVSDSGTVPREPYIFDFNYQVLQRRNRFD